MSRHCLRPSFNQVNCNTAGGIELCTVTGIRLGTGDFGISPGEGELCVTLRAGEESVMKRMEEKLAAFARQAGVDAEIRVRWYISGTVLDIPPCTQRNMILMMRSSGLPSICFWDWCKWQWSGHAVQSIC